MKRTIIGLLFAIASVDASAQGPQASAAAATPAPPPISNAEFASRRAALAASLPDGVILAIGGREPEADYLSFYQSTNFRYLTGVKEPDAALVGIKKGNDVQWTLFVQPKDPSREVWSGRRVGAEAAEAQWGIKGRVSLQLNGYLDSLLATTQSLFVVASLGSPQLKTFDDQFIAALTAKHPSVQVRSAIQNVSRLRAFMSPAELALITRATAITVDAHAEAAKAIRADGNEYEVDAVVSYTFRRNGAERSSFASIVGSGPNATTLHYNANDRQIKAGEVVVVDIGASVEGYSADMTRTYPVNGTFTAEQRAIYQIVRDAQSAAERQAKIGARANLMSDSASAALAAGLAKLGLIESPTATYDCSADGSRKCSQLSLYYMHGLGHGIGLEVHDPDRYYLDGTLGEGSVFTLEPGIYVRENLLDILPKTERNAQLAAKLRPLLERYRNIGIRIEDDYIVTEKGLEGITRSPRELSEIERRRM